MRELRKRCDYCLMFVKFVLKNQCDDFCYVCSFDQFSGNILTAQELNQISIDFLVKEQEVQMFCSRTGIEL